MKIDFSKTINDFSGEPLQDYRIYPNNQKVGIVDDAGAPQHMTLKVLCIRALMEEDAALKAEDKLHRNQIGEQIFAADDELDLSVDDVSMLKKLVDKSEYGKNPRVLAQAWKLLDPPAEPKKEESQPDAKPKVVEA